MKRVGILCDECGERYFEKENCKCMDCDGYLNDGCIYCSKAYHEAQFELEMN